MCLWLGQSQWPEVWQEEGSLEESEAVTFIKRAYIINSIPPSNTWEWCGRGEGKKICKEVWEAGEKGEQPATSLEARLAGW